MHFLKDTYLFLSKGGIMMIPLAVSSLIAVAIILERAFQLQRKRVITPSLLHAVVTIKDARGLDVAWKLSEQSTCPFGRILRTCFEFSHLDKDELKELIEDQARQEVRVLEKGLGALETIAAAAPLMGLLGTVIGMIKVFNVISQVGVGQASALSGGISEALITTVVGLSIGIPTLIFHNYFIHRSESLILDIEKYLVLFLQKQRQLTQMSQPSNKESGSPIK